MYGYCRIKKGLQVIVFDNGVLKIITIIKYYNCSGDQPRTLR